MENRKRQYSRKMIEEAFISELRTKPLDKISIVQICKLADVNRSTFYANYLDVYDLMDQVSQKFFEKLFYKSVEQLGAPNPNGKKDSVRFVEQAIYATLEEKELCALLVGSFHSGSFTNKLLDILLDWSTERYMAYSGKDPVRFRVENTMVMGGALVLWRRWIEGGFRESPELVISAVHRFVEANTARVWNHTSHCD